MRRWPNDDSTLMGEYTAGEAFYRSLVSSQQFGNIGVL